MWNEAVQLLPMSCINQPFIELVLHEDLELLPLLLSQPSLLHSFLPDLYLPLSLSQHFLVSRGETPWYLCRVPFHLKGNNKYVEFTRWQEPEDSCVTAFSAHNHWVIPVVRNCSKASPGHMVLQHWVMGMEWGKSHILVPRENKWT